MILNTPKPIPEHAIREIEKQDFIDNGYMQVRRCAVSISEEDAMTYIDPESFYYCDVYGECELTQVIREGVRLPVIISKFQNEKNPRSFEAEAARQHDLVSTAKHIVAMVVQEGVDHE